uniref:hypothetical protein n=1 Tax=Micromonospora sp. NBC_00855 TaxID=2975978 RepID=UPI002255EAEA|nr:hypothetical protein OHB51_35395 [Micromonospora sp. NBC_00855]
MTTTAEDVFDAKLPASACMSTSEQIAEALTILRAIPNPGAAFTSALATIEAVVDPVVVFARHVLSRWSDDPPYPEQAAKDLIEMAAQYGLRITTDPGPGELVGYSYVKPREFDPGWILIDDAGTWQPGDLDMAEEQAEGVQRVVALYLPTESGKS